MSYSRYALLFGVLGMLACTQAVKPLPDKNTNWLKACEADAECGSELACLCGACTKACKSDAQCGETASGSKCLAAGDPAVQAVCGTKLEVTAVCSAECKRDRDCDAQADGLRCQAGLCVPSAASNEPAACTPGEVIAKICGQQCPGLNENAFATCGSDGNYGPCECQDPRCGPAVDCAAGYICYRNGCREAANRCVEVACEAGADCIDGLCVRVLVEGLSSPGEMGIGDDGDLYFVNHGTYEEGGQFKFDAMLAKMPLQGGAYQRVREDLNEIGHTVFVGDAAYWFNVGKGAAFQVTGKLFRSDVPTSIFLVDHAQSPLVADANAFYWLEQKRGTGPVDLMRASRAVVQPEPVRLLTLPEPATALTQSGDRLYWGTAASGLWSANKDGTDVTRVVEPRPELQGPSAFAVDSSGVYWSWTTEPETVGLGLYAATPDLNLSLTEDMSARLGDSLALDDTHAYWVYAVSGDEQYSLARTSKVPFATEVVWRSSELKAATKILVHDGFLYVSTLPEPGQGKILRIQRPRLAGQP
jgi:hypothetical protein